MISIAKVFIQREKDLRGYEDTALPVKPTLGNLNLSIITF